MKNLAALNIRLENNLEIARTLRDTGKTPLINYAIGNNRKKIFEKKQKSLQYTATSHVVHNCVVRRGCELQIYLLLRKKKV